MLCPKCTTGSIHVMTIIACTCGHNPLLCDHCFTVFDVPCGPTQGAAALPPEAPMTENTNFPKAHKKLAKQTGSTQTYPEMLAQFLQESPESLPLLENFKASLAA